MGWSGVLCVWFIRLLCSEVCVCVIAICGWEFFVWLLLLVVVVVYCVCFRCVIMYLLCRFGFFLWVYYWFGFL